VHSLFKVKPQIDIRTLLHSGMTMEAAAFQRKVKNLESSHDHNGLGLKLDAIKTVVSIVV